jgi:hypothetical protein
MKRFPNQTFETHSEQPATQVLQEQELLALRLLRGAPPPKEGEPLTMGQAALLVAEVGGYQRLRAKKSPGKSALAVGLRRFEGAVEALSLLAGRSPKEVSSFLASVSLAEASSDPRLTSFFGRKGSFESDEGLVVRSKFLLHWGKREPHWGATSVASWVKKAFLSPQEVLVLAFLSSALLFGPPEKLSLGQAALWLHDLGSEQKLAPALRWSAMASGPCGFRRLEGAREVLRNLALLSEEERTALLAFGSGPEDEPAKTLPRKPAPSSQRRPSLLRP